jgi:DNA-binding MarR family transcriptional regulator
MNPYPSNDDGGETGYMNGEERMAKIDAFTHLTETLWTLLTDQVMATPELGSLSLTHIQLLYWLEQRSPVTLCATLREFAPSAILTRRLLRKLVRARWVKRCGDLLDPRVVYLVLTPAGLLRLTRLETLQRRQYEILLNDLSPAERRLLARGLELLFPRNPE